MAEVLGTISAALQVAELGGRLSVKLWTFAHKFKNADKALRSLSNDVALTCSVLRQLGDSLGQDDLVSLYSPDAFATAQDVLEECKKVFRDIESEIEQQHPDPSSSKSRMERATRKLWFLMNEPRLDAVAGNLERLKSTMLLMLNVVIYAGQLRSRHEVNKAQEQRELLQMLAIEKVETEKKFKQLTTSIQFFNLNIQNHGNNPSFESRRQDSGKPNDELERYVEMVMAVLKNIDTAQHFLDQDRYQRLKGGFVRLHQLEAQQLNQKYGERASQLLSQLGKILAHDGAIQQKLEPQALAQSVSAPVKKKKRKISRDPATDLKPSLEPTGNSIQEPPKQFPNSYHPDSTSSSLPDMPETYFSLDFTPLDNPEILESFDFDTFLNADENGTGFGCDPDMSLAYLEPESDQKVPLPQAQLEPKQQAPSGDHDAPPAYEDSSLENPDVWILRWTTLEKTELCQ